MLRVDPPVASRLVDLAESGRPAEICGVLGGRFGQRYSVVSTVYPVRNVAETPRTRYRLDPSAQLRAMDECHSRDLDVVGFYHSHPRGPPQPSETDRRLGTWEGYSYVIISLGADTRIGSWRVANTTFGRERVRVQASAETPT